MYDNRNKILVLLLVLLLLFSLFTIFISSETALSLSAKSAALYVPETETFLYSDNANQRLPMASTTKIMTALLALEKIPPDEIITATKDTVGIEGSSVYLKEGEKLQAIDLVYALMLQSANDAAATLAYRISGSIEDFAALMNERACEIGLRDTNFENPHGLDSKDHYTTAHDLALLAAEALKNEDFKKITSTYKKEIESSKCTRVLVNHNKMLKSYDTCIGIKTGYTKKSGRSLVSAAERNGLTLIAVTINAPDDWRDHKEMLDYGYSLIEKVTLSDIGDYSYDLPVLDGEIDTVKIQSNEKITKILNKDNNKYDVQIKLSRYAVAPINEGDILGKVIFTKDGEIIGESNLIATETINKKTKKKAPFSFFRIKKDS